MTYVVKVRFCDFVVVLKFLNIIWIDYVFLKFISILNNWIVELDKVGRENMNFFCLCRVTFMLYLESKKIYAEDLWILINIILNILLNINFV